MDFLFFFFLIILMISLFKKNNPIDDSDSLNERSGLTVRTDHLTGLQYLETITGGITPRLDASGNQICIKTKATGYSC